MNAVNKHLEKAERFLQKEKLESALEELLGARREEPGNDSVVLMMADVYQRMNKVKEYRQCYGYLFDKAVQAGDSSKAVEFLKKLESIGAIEPKRLIGYAQLLEKQHPEEAVKYYQRALETVGEQDPEISLQCLQAIATLHPASWEVYTRIAEFAGKLGKKSIAAGAYARMGALLLADRKYQEAVDALEAAYSLSGGSGSAKLALAKACAAAKRFPRVLELLQKDSEEFDDPHLLKLVADALFAGKDLPRSEALYWKLGSSEAYDALIEIAIEYVRRQDFKQAEALLKKLQERLSGAKDQKRLSTIAEKLSRIEHSNVAILEFLCKLADHLHLDTPFSIALNALFNIYYAAGDFRRATEILERLVDVDAYAPECSQRLQQLEGKADPALWKDLAARLGKTATVSVDAFDNPPSSTDNETASADTAAGGKILGDLILQAEIFLQYKLEDKARERLQRITKLFPGEEEKNEQLRELFERAKFNPQHSSAGRHSTPGLTTAVPAGWSRMSEISRNIARQATVKGVLSTAVNDIGKLWQVSRCVIGLATPKHPPSIVLEYISPGVPASDASQLGKLVMGLQQITAEREGALVAEQVSEVSELTPLKPSLAALKVASLVAIPLRENDQPAGILVLEQCDCERNWKDSDMAALEALAEQLVFAISNARLRSLMKTLAVTDERSGLLHRDSYLTCLLSEVERMRAQKTPLTATILQFVAPKQAGESQNSLEPFMEQFESIFASHLRQTDIPLKYAPHTLAVIMPGSTSKEAVFMVEKMRKLSASASGSDAPPAMAAGIAEILHTTEMDSVDIVTDLINRVEFALDEAVVNGGNATKSMEPPVLPA